MYGRAPYKGLLTHGFTVDSQGRKMSKSWATASTRRKVSKKLGAEIIRLWVAASDYSGDIAGDDKILARVVDAYRRIRNTLRFLLANVSDFDPATDAVPLDEMLEIDRYALARAANCRPTSWRTTRSTSSTRWWPSCRCTAAKTWAPSTWTC
jgi:isoleucyl-tRNA synthetase